MPGITFWKVNEDKVRAEGIVNLFMRWMEQYPDCYGTLFLIIESVPFNIMRYNEELGRRYARLFNVSLNEFDYNLFDCVRTGGFTGYSCSIYGRVYDFDTLAVLQLVPNLLAIATYAR